MYAPITLLAFFDGFGGSELILVLAVVLMFFGGEKLPELARGMGKAMREFKKAANEVEHEFTRAMDEAPAKPAPTFLKPAPSAVPQAPLQAMPIAPEAGPITPAPVPPPPPTVAPEPPADHGIDA